MGRYQWELVLFIHGIFSCAKLWDPFFQPFFAAHGYTSHALSVRGHGASEGQDRIPTTRLRDYFADVEQVAARITPAPVMVGVIVLHYIRRHAIPVAVLMAPGPPHGMISSTLPMIATNPFLAYEPDS